jgi:hypothetical protein
MAGSDAWRGIDFQAAYTVALALDVLSGEAGEILAVDPGPDIVDYCTREKDRTLRVLGQAKTRGERSIPSATGAADSRPSSASNCPWSSVYRWGPARA